ncbi:hypothetical protein SSBR45G_72340 [Bradyrhizobium sp. SSBR45G]|nr:hypothetical protein SSBR45G_72340 [Bradyrhizobium sp. SSBR45G]GLH89774.1 hypothetical protein SSBR45R_72350 [Bradyrhizobium sp. SSBR45R]
MSWPDLWFLPRALPSARGPRVSADARPSLHPRFCEGSMLMISLGTIVLRDGEVRADADADTANQPFAVIPDKHAATRAPIRDP